MSIPSPWRRQALDGGMRGRIKQINDLAILFLKRTVVVGLCGITLMGATSLVCAQARSDTPCFPGLECAQTARTSIGGEIESGPVSGFGFTEHFVLDGPQNLLWSRNLYAIGDTTVAYKIAYAGNESFGSALSKIKATASSASVGGVSGWRLATPAELNTLLERLAPTTIYAYFRPRVPDLPIRSVMGALDYLEEGTRVVADGMLYSNTSDGRASGHYGGAELNRFGFWMVKSLTPDVERAVARVAEPLRQYYEPVEERRLKPVDVFQLRRRNEVVDADPTRPVSAIVSTTTALNARFVARYNMKPLPRGALVSAEVLMRGLSGNGAPLPTVLVQVIAGAAQKTTAPKDLWALAGSTDAGIWQMLGNARLELPAHIVRNTFNTQEDFYIGFSANFNSCTFQIPEVIVQFVREQNLLVRRQLP